MKTLQTFPVLLLVVPCLLLWPVWGLWAGLGGPDGMLPYDQATLSTWVDDLRNDRPSVWCVRREDHEMVRDFGQEGLTNQCYDARGVTSGVTKTQRCDSSGEYCRDTGEEKRWAHNPVPVKRLHPRAD